VGIALVRKSLTSENTLEVSKYGSWEERGSVNGKGRAKSKMLRSG